MNRTETHNQAQKTDETAVLPLSVLVIAFNGASCLERCLDSLAEQREAPPAEVLVVGDFTGAGQSAFTALQAKHADFQWVTPDAQRSVPFLRGAGMARAKGKIIALIEDDCIAPPDWFQKIVTAHQTSAASAIGGAVEPGDYRRNVDWAVFFAEYGGRFLLPLPEGEPAALPGTNISYKAAALDALAARHCKGAGRAEFARIGFYEAFEHPALREIGGAAKMDSSLIVYNINSWPLLPTLQSRYHHGRGYAGMRLAGKSLLRRLPYAGVTPLLPAMQIARIARDVLRRRRHVPSFFRSLPNLLLCAMCWSAGEFNGYAFGPGRSLARWR